MLPPSNMAVVVPIVGVAMLGAVVIGIVLSKVKVVAIPPPPQPRIKAVVIPMVGVVIVGVSVGKSVGVNVGVRAGRNNEVNPPPGVGIPGVPPNKRAAFLV